jgi:RNA polymerase sigma factor (sigma-70 family)
MLASCARRVARPLLPGTPRTQEGKAQPAPLRYTDGVRSSEDFDDVYRRHAPIAFRRANRLLGTETEAHQVVHEVFLWLYERPAQYREQTHLSTSLYNAVTSACLNRLNRSRARDQAAHARDADPLRTLLVRMPAALAEVAVYYCMDELTPVEIARVLDTTRVHVDATIERLLKWMAEHDHDHEREAAR